MTAASHLARARSSGRRFLAWWSGELSEALATRASRSRAWKVMFLHCEDGYDTYVRARGGIERVGTVRDGADWPVGALRRRLGRARLAPAEIVLRLQPGEVVQTHLSVPAAAGDVLEPILRNQIERLAPWPADKALFAYEAVPPAGGSATLDVPLAITGRSLVEGLVAELEALGFAPGVVDYGTDAAAEPRLNLLAIETGGSRRTGRLLLAGVGVVCLLCLVAGTIGTLGVVQQTRERNDLNARHEALRSRVAEDLPSRASLRRQAQLTAQKLSHPATVVVLEALSRVLPDDAWLSWLEVDKEVVRLGGNAASAAALIGLIEASGHFTDVKFAAPTTLAEEDGRETFTITARIVPGRKLK